MNLKDFSTEHLLTAIQELHSNGDQSDLEPEAKDELLATENKAKHLGYSVSQNYLNGIILFERQGISGYFEVKVQTQEIEIV